MYDSVSEYRPTLRQRLEGRIHSAGYRLKNGLTKAALALVVWLNRNSNYAAHVRREVPEWFKEEDGPNRWIADGTLELLAVISSQGHSGNSIGFALKFFSEMALFKPWGPLTGADDEWIEIADNRYQNKRCSHVFKEDGRAYDINGRIFREPNGACYTSKDSFVDITFPYTPKSEYVDVAEASHE